MHKMNNCFRNIAESEVQVGVSLYAILVYCNTEAIKTLNFHMSLLYSNSIRTIIQATKNTIVSEILEEYENQENAKQFYLALIEKLGLELGNSLHSLLLTSEVNTMKNNGWPFLTTVTNITLPGSIYSLSSITPIFPQTHHSAHTQCIC